MAKQSGADTTHVLLVATVAILCLLTLWAWEVAGIRGDGAIGAFLILGVIALLLTAQLLVLLPLHGYLLHKARKPWGKAVAGWAALSLAPLVLAFAWSLVSEMRLSGAEQDVVDIDFRASP